MKNQLFHQSAENMDFEEDPFNLEENEEHKYVNKEPDLLEVRSLFTSRIDIKSQASSRQNLIQVQEESKVEDLFELNSPPNIVQSQFKFSEDPATEIKDASELIPSTKYIGKVNLEPLNLNLEQNNKDLINSDVSEKSDPSEGEVRNKSHEEVKSKQSDTSEKAESEHSQEVKSEHSEEMKSKSSEEMKSEKSEHVKFIE